MSRKPTLGRAGEGPGQCRLSATRGQPGAGVSYLPYWGRCRCE